MKSPSITKQGDFYRVKGVTGKPILTMDKGSAMMIFDSKVRIMQKRNNTIADKIAKR